MPFIIGCAEASIIALSSSSLGQQEAELLTAAPSGRTSPSVTSCPSSSSSDSAGER